MNLDHRQRGVSRRALAGVEANARLTGGTAVVLLVLLFLEGVTILRILPLLTWHVAIGLVLVPVVVVKLGSTGWRFARYYLGSRGYVAKGPPPPALRLLGPIVVVLTAVLFASGIALLLAPHALGGQLLFLHKASFVLWFLAMAVHVLGHLAETARLAPRDWMPRTRRSVRGAPARLLLSVASLVVGAALAGALTGRTAHFKQVYFRSPPAAASTGH